MKGKQKRAFERPFSDKIAWKDSSHRVKNQKIGGGGGGCGKNHTQQRELWTSISRMGAGAKQNVTNPKYKVEKEPNGVKIEEVSQGGMKKPMLAIRGFKTEKQ